jgi:TonB family protein
MSFQSLLVGFALLLGGPATTPDISADMTGYVVRPYWTNRPTRDDLERLYPHKAKGVQGDVKVDCLIDENGRFTSCDVVSESPSGLGFGDSTIALSKLFRMKPVDGDGLPVAGRKLRLPVRWYSGFSN